MARYLKGTVIRLRCKKDYSGAHNHVIIGRVVEDNPSYIAVQGCSFHFAGILNRNGIRQGHNTIRVIPWSNVEIIHWLDDTTKEVDWTAEVKFDEKNVRFVLADEAKTVIAARNDGMG